MSQKPILIADMLSDFEQTEEPVQVALTNELVRLLSDQLYQSPLKAIEELVVNAYDADATECRLYVPRPSDVDKDFIIVFDDGVGMDRDGLTDLWQIGRSNKRDEEIQRRRKRKQIGKFGIGKLATYTIANRLTYITKSDDQILSVTIDFAVFEPSPTGESEPIEMPVRLISSWDEFSKRTHFQDLLDFAHIDSSKLSADNATSWTIAILEDLKGKARKITKDRLDWVLSTAMPLRSGFHLYLNGDEVVSSKEAYPKVVEFNIAELAKNRLKALRKKTGEAWHVENDSLVSGSFPSGISGTVFVTERSLLGKSDDIKRSHGFFIRVFGRLVNEVDPLFGLKPLVHQTFNRFRAEIEADDLDKELKASRETIEESKWKETFRVLLREVFNEADSRYQKHCEDDEAKNGKHKEGEKVVVAPHLVEYPIADALTIPAVDSVGQEADDSWFYLDVADQADLTKLVETLYTVPRDKYHYQLTQEGTTARLVRFDPATSVFWINEDHDLAREYVRGGQARFFLEDFVTAETLLEVYLRESQIPPHVIGNILERRDALLRSLVKDHPYSLSTISSLLRDAAVDEHELEVAIVVAVRALGFVATQISGPSKPDGLARFIDYPDGEKIITLEAKSSEDVPSLGAIDFAGLHQHMVDEEANGCLLVAPDYPGSSRNDDAQAAKRAQEQHISCWTVEQLAQFIEAAESRQLTARSMLDIVLNYYSPIEVTKALEKHLKEPTWDSRALYCAILGALRQLEKRLKDSPRTVDMVATTVSSMAEFADVGQEEVRKAVQELASASQGGMTYRAENETLVIHVSHDELGRRLGGLTKQSGEPRKLSSFKKT